MANHAVSVSSRRFAKIVNRLRRDGVSTLPNWAMDWVYWKGGLYQIPRLHELRAKYKYNRRTKKFGIQDPVLVYQMGKVGSSSIYYSLLRLDLDVPIHQIHFLNHIDHYEQWMRSTMPNNTAAPKLFGLARSIRRELDSAPGRRWNLISLVRAPIPRAISSFFQNLDAAFPSYRQRVAENQLTAREIADFFVNQYYDILPQQWFDTQIKAVFGIDVYASEFPKARGYQIYEQDNIRLVVIRMEDLRSCAAEAMHEFLGIADFQLVNKNIGDEKKYADLYREFRQLLRLPPEYVQKMHSTQYAQHFYTVQELAESVRQWL